MACSVSRIPVLAVFWVVLAYTEAQCVTATRMKTKANSERIIAKADPQIIDALPAESPRQHPTLTEAISMVSRTEWKNQVEEFVQQWQLDEAAQRLLLGLAPVVQQRVLAQFAPSDTTRGASVAFAGFVLSMFRDRSLTKPWNPVEEFVQRWQLDVAAQLLLLGLEPGVQKSVLARFAPSDTTRGTSAIFTGFVRSMLKLVKPIALASDEIQQFALHWSLDTRAQVMLATLDPDIQARVVRDFLPFDIKNGASCAFMGFVTSVLKSEGRSMPSRSGSSDEAPEAAFIRTWGLDAGAVEAFGRLDAVTKECVMSNFAPWKHKHASAAFMGFVKSVTHGGWKGAPPTAAMEYAPPAEIAPGGVAPPAAIAYAPSPQRSPVISFSYGRFAASVSHDEMLNGFIALWELDRQAQDALMRCDPLVQQRVINDFAPRDISRGASEELIAFISSVTGGLRAPDSHEGAPTMASSQVDSLGYAPDPNGGLAGAAAMTHPQVVGAGVVSGDSVIEDFCSRWALDESACQVLRSLDPATQQRVIHGFAPTDVSRGASLTFMGFVRIVAPASFHGVHTSVGRSPDAISAFVRYWGLDVVAENALRQLDYADQLRAMRDFQPRDVSRGASMPFMFFIKSIAPWSFSRNVAAGARPAQQMAPYVIPAQPPVQARPAQQMAQYVMPAQPSVQARSAQQTAQHVMPALPPVQARPAQQTAQYVMPGLPPVQATLAPVPMTRPSGAACDAIRAALIEAFVVRWGLDRQAQDVLLALDPVTLQRVINDFAPRHMSAGASSAFIGFARSAIAGMGNVTDRGASSAFIGFARSVIGGMGNVMPPLPLPSAPVSSMHPMQHTAFAASMRNSLNDPVRAFVARWGLDSTDEDVLRGLDSELQHRVMAQFWPKDVSRGASYAFRGFVKGVVAVTEKRLSRTKRPLS